MTVGVVDFMSRKLKEIFIVKPPHKVKVFFDYTGL